ncbi:hypothetical protein ElyMa_002496400 [Elysia marginata]|uniref:G-protein coupled receptors family 1 profile domain-containing protein n=1 Tax=Elysia marginata TaxID=1093978 RepID=A0AAV4GQI3_9GAST|nr:hypothetical protein ElyMa_002496400 [Elysia marginata]
MSFVQNLTSTGLIHQINLFGENNSTQIDSYSKTEHFWSSNSPHTSSPVETAGFDLSLSDANRTDITKLSSQIPQVPDGEEVPSVLSKLLSEAAVTRLSQLRSGQTFSLSPEEVSTQGSQTSGNFTRTPFSESQPTEFSEILSTPFSEILSTPFSKILSTPFSKILSTPFSESLSIQYTDSLSTQYADTQSTEFADSLSAEYTDGLSNEYNEGLSTQFSEGLSTQFSDSLSTNFSESSSTQFSDSDITTISWLERNASLSQNILFEPSGFESNTFTENASEGVFSTDFTQTSEQFPYWTLPDYDQSDGVTSGMVIKVLILVVICTVGTVGNLMVVYTIVKVSR